MGLLDVLLGKTNGFSQFADNNSNLLGALGAGIAQGPTFSQGLSNAAQAIPQAKTLDQANAKALQSQNATVAFLKAKYPDLAAAVDGGMPVQTAWTTAMQRDAEANKVYNVGAGVTLVQNGKPVFSAPDPVGKIPDLASTYQGRLQIAQEQGLAGNDKLTFALTGKLPGGNQTARAGVGQPVPFRDKRTGEIVAGMPMTDGSYVDGRTGKNLDSNYEYDPTGLAFSRASGGAQGKIAGGVEATLPIAAQTAQNALDTIAKLRTDKEGQAASFGTYGIGPIQIPDRYGLTIAQTPKANFQAVLQQAGGQAFLQAYSTLRGAGAISDAEGQKAGAAISRMMNPDISQDSFNAALDDYEAIIKAGYSRIQQQAAKTGVDPATMPQINAPMAAPDIQSLLDKYR